MMILFSDFFLLALAFLYRFCGSSLYRQCRRLGLTAFERLNLVFQRSELGARGLLFGGQGGHLLAVLILLLCHFFFLLFA